MNVPIFLSTSSPIYTFPLRRKKKHSSPWISLSITHLYDYISIYTVVGTVGIGAGGIAATSPTSAAKLTAKQKNMFRKGTYETRPSAWEARRPGSLGSLGSHLLAAERRLGKEDGGLRDRRLLLALVSWLCEWSDVDGGWGREKRTEATSRCGCV
jgi:hypothetical protein